MVRVVKPRCGTALITLASVWKTNCPRRLIRMPMVYVFGSHDRMKDHERRLGFMAKSGLPVLIEGECGTGKETFAELLHDLSGTGNGFTKISCRQSGPVVHPSGGNGALELSQI